jgi:DNA polymerase/3'-5' exonuclease PolX
MKNEEARTIAEKYLNILKPFCQRIEIAGSIRREKPEVKDIELVAIPKDIEGFANEVNKLEKVKGEPTGKYTQRILPEGINLDLFIANERNWGLIFAIRTGSADFSHKILACGWVKKGYHSVNGMLIDKYGNEVEIRKEEELFKLIGISYISPQRRHNR